MPLNRRILYITRTDPTKKGGGSMGEKSFIMAFERLYPGMVDLIMADSCDTAHFSLPVRYYLVPSRNSIFRYLSLLTGSLHRFKNFVKGFLSLHHDQYEMCVFGGSIVAGDLVDFVHSLGIKTITVHHNYEKEYHLDNKSIESFKGLFPYYVIRNERNAYLKSDLNLFVTEQDKNTFLQVYGPSKGLTKVRGVSETEGMEESLPVTPMNDNHPFTVVISGTLSSHQTKVGIVEFYQRYYAVIRDLFPQMKIIVTGRDPGDELKSIILRHQDSMELVPNPTNIEQVIRRGDLYLCPTHIGGGLKLRLMDGLKAGLPVLTHQVSARGYDVFFDKPWFQIFYDKESFQTGLKVLVDGIQHQRWSSDEIHQAYLDFFSFDAGVERLRQCLIGL
ncbi:MAG: hypothetical protein ACP5F6_07785 [Microbacter sp.]